MMREQRLTCRSACNRAISVANWFSTTLRDTRWFTSGRFWIDFAWCAYVSVDAVSS